MKNNKYIKGLDQAVDTKVAIALKENRVDIETKYSYLFLYIMMWDSMVVHFAGTNFPHLEYFLKAVLELDVNVLLNHFQEVDVSYLKIYEYLLNRVVRIYSFLALYDLSKSVGSKNFIVNYICISVPVQIRAWMYFFLLIIPLAFIWFLGFYFGIFAEGSFFHIYTTEIWGIFLTTFSNLFFYFRVIKCMKITLNIK